MRRTTAARFLWPLILTVGIAYPGQAGAGDPAPPAGTAANPTATIPVAMPAEPDPAQVETWLAAARALKQAQPVLFDGAAGVLATLVLPGGQGAGAGIVPGDVLIGYGDTPLDSRGQLIALTGKTPPEQTLTLRWLRPGAGGGAEVLGVAIHGGRMGVGIRDLADTPAARMQALSDEGLSASNRARYGEAMGLFRQGLALAEEAGDDLWRGQLLRSIGDVLDDLGRYPEALAHHGQALDIAREIGDRAGEASSLNGLGDDYQLLSRYPESLEHYTQALAIDREIGDRAGEAGNLNGLGNVYQLLGRYPEALEHHRQALAIAREMGHRAGEGAHLHNLGMVYRSLGRYLEAVEHHTQALAIHRELGNRAGEGADLGSLGNVYYNLGRYPEAVEHHTQALAIHREIGDRAGEGADLHNLGMVYHGLGRYPEAVEHYTQALAIDREIGDRAGEGAVLGSLGAVYARLGRNPEALEYFTQALAIDREIGDRAGEGTVLGNLGAVNQSLGRYLEALEHHTQALEIARKVGNRAGEAANLTGLGNVYQSLGRYPEALEHFSLALDTFHEIRDPAQEGIVLMNLGVVYQDLGRYPEALERFTQALDIFREIGDRAGEGRAFGNIGSVYQSLGHYPEALEHYRQALAIARVIGDREGQGRAIGDRGIVYALLGRYPEALEHFTQALTLVRELGERGAESSELLNLGNLHTDQGRSAEALVHYQQALALQAELNEPETLWLLWNNMRVAWEDASRPAPAILAGKRAVNAIQAMRVGNASLTREQQQSFLANKEFVYRELADLLITQARHAEAQQVLDMLKEQELYDYIKEEGAHDPRQTRAGNNAMESEWNEAYDAVAAGAPPLAQRLAELTRVNPAIRTESEQTEIVRLTAERDRLDAELQRQLAALPERLAAVEPTRQAAENTRFAKAPDAKPAVLAALSQRSGTRTGLLQFVLLDEQVRILLTTPDGWETAVAEAPVKTLAAEIEALRSALTDPTQDAEPPAKVLYGRLVAPLAQKIDAAKLESLLVHLDGRLRYVPFAALHDGQQWLAERWPIVYYTAASERQGGRQDVRQSGRAAPDWRVAGLGTTKAHPPAFTALPAVEAEIDGIVRTGKSDRKGVLPGRVFLDKSFTEKVLRAQAADSANRILHIASHFDLRPGRDTESSLLLGTGGRLSLHDLREREPRLDLRHLDLVTLSACNTAMGGADATGAEIEGMGAIIQRQGAHGVLASLWPVADRSTGTLMQTFYRLRAERPDLTKAQALQQAQLGLLRGTHDRPAAGRKAGVPPGSDCAVARRPVSLSDEGGKLYQPPADPACRWSHPYYWAPFILMGNWL